MTVPLDTGWNRHFGTPPCGEPAPLLTEAGATAVIEAGVVLVGIDSVDIDDTSPESGGARLAHTLLAADVHVVEHLTGLDRLPEFSARFTAFLPDVAGFGTFPVRAYAEIESE